ncbi:MAG: AmmeMemoRadiSam system protein B [Candidatus Nealsonbacteria bacterium]|nr:AmmeMemoRadiSam system protein B [Candidatus Nealsonbacteria bacterium]
MLRVAAAAGEFYPEDKKELGDIIDKLLNQAEPFNLAQGKIFGLLLPHASYDYSGQAAAYGFNAIAGKNFDTVIIISDSHYERFDGVAVYPAGLWETPLGKIEVDNDLARTVLAKSKRFLRRDSAHLWEHAIEVQLPFLQKILKKFKILPIVFGSENKDWQELADVISKNILKKKILIIASADLSHYLPYGKAQKIDQKTITSILNLQNKNLDICSIDAARTLIKIAKNMSGRAKLLKYANSADVSGDKSKTVGYGAVAFYR